MLSHASIAVNLLGSAAGTQDNTLVRGPRRKEYSDGPQQGIPSPNLVLPALWPQVQVADCAET